MLDRALLRNAAMEDRISDVGKQALALGSQFDYPAIIVAVGNVPANCSVGRKQCAFMLDVRRCRRRSRSSGVATSSQPRTGGVACVVAQAVTENRKAARKCFIVPPSVA